MTATNQAVDSQQWRLSFGHVIRSEYLKLVTLRSLRWTFVITLILLIGTNLLIASLLDTADLREASKAGNFAVLIEFGAVVAQLSAVVLGVLYVTGEYSSGMVKLTFSGVPRRNTVVAAKGVEVSLATEGVFTVLVGQVVFLTFITLLGLFLGWIFRSTPLSIVIGFALMFVVPLAILQIPGIPQVVVEYAPSALSQMAIGDLTLLEGSIAVVVYIAVLWVIAAAVVSRRDV